MKNKKILSAVLAICMSLTLGLTGCTETSGVDKETENTKETVSESEENESKGSVEESETDESESSEEPNSSSEESSEPESESEPSTAATQPAPIAPATSIDGVALIQYAYQTYIGKTPYVWGGESPAGADCSGFIVDAYRHFGVSLPHYSGALTDQSNYQKVQIKDTLPGDIIGATGGVIMIAGMQKYKRFGVSYLTLVDDGYLINENDFESYTYLSLTDDEWKQKQWDLNQPGGYTEISEELEDQHFINVNFLSTYKLKEDESGERYKAATNRGESIALVLIGFPEENGVVRYNYELFGVNDIQTFSGFTAYRPITNTAATNQCQIPTDDFGPLGRVEFYK